MQIIINDVNLDNGTYRRMLGQIKNTEIAGIKTVTCTFIIQGDTPTELNTRWAEAQAAFNKHNPRCVIYGDDTASVPTEEVSWTDGLHTAVESTISWDPAYTQTSYRFMCTLVISAASSIPSPGGGTGPGDKFQGQEGSIKIIETLSTGGVKNRVVEATFGTTFDKTKYGPFALNTASPPSVINGTGGFAGKTAFVLVGSLPTFKVGQKITVAGTVNYNGVFEVLAITGQVVQTSKPFGSTESPSAATGTIGEAKTGEENYLAAKSVLFTDYLKTASDGGRDATSGYAFTGQTYRFLDKEGTSVLVTMSAAEMMINVTATQPAARTFEVMVSVQEPDKWNTAGGAIPIVYTAKGRVVIDRVAFASSNLSGVFASAKADILAEVATQAGVAATALKIISLSQALSRDAMWVEFQISYMSTSVSALFYKVTVQEDESQPILSHRDADGYHVLQIPPGPKDATVTKVVHRVGYGQINLGFALAPPVQSGFTFVEIARSKLKDDPETTPAGEEVFDQAWSATFQRFRLRKGGSAIGGAQGSGGAFDGQGYWTPTGPDV